MPSLYPSPLPIESELSHSKSAAAARKDEVTVALTNYRDNNGLSENTKKDRQLS